jgi:hypothetical protein
VQNAEQPGLPILVDYEINCEDCVVGILRNLTVVSSPPFRKLFSLSIWKLR